MLVGRDALLIPFVWVSACLHVGKVFAGFYLVAEGTFSGLNQVVYCVLVGVLLTGNLNCVELISGDLHTPNVNDDVSVVCVI